MKKTCTVRLSPAPIMGPPIMDVEIRDGDGKTMKAYSMNTGVSGVKEESFEDLNNTDVIIKNVKNISDQILHFCKQHIKIIEEACLRVFGNIRWSVEMNFHHEGELLVELLQENVKGTITTYTLAGGK